MHFVVDKLWWCGGGVKSESEQFFRRRQVHYFGVGPLFLLHAFINSITVPTLSTGFEFERKVCLVAFDFESIKIVVLFK